MKVEISKDFLIDQYVKNKKSSFDIASIVGCHYGAVLRRLKEYGIKIRSPYDYPRTQKQIEHCRKIGKRQKTEKQILAAKKNVLIMGRLPRTKKQLENSRFCGLLVGSRSGSRSNAYQNGESLGNYFGFTYSLKEKIRRRDNRICQLCGLSELKAGKKSDIHHIDYDKKNNDELNLISLCTSCHSKTNRNRDYWKTILSDLIKEKYDSSRLRD